MADKTVILELKLDSKQLEASAKEAETALKRLTPQLAEVAATSGKNSVEYAKLKEEVKKYTKQLNDSSAALQINDDLSGKVNLTTIEQARAQKALATAYNALTKEQRENTEEGKSLTAQYLAMNEALQEQGLEVSDGRRSVGLYEKAILSANKTIKGLKDEQRALGFAMTSNTKKLDDAKKGLDKLDGTLGETSAEYKQLSEDVEFYTNALITNNKVLGEVNKELNDQEEQLKATTKEAAAIGFVYGNNEKNAESLKKQLKDLKTELAGIDPNSAAFLEGTARAAELADQIQNVNEAIAAQTSGSKFEILANQVELIGGDLANLDFEGVAEKAKAFQEIAGNISLDDLVKGAKQAGQALLSLGKTLLASPIFLVLAGVGLIVAFWDDISKAINGTNVAQEALNSTIGDYKKGAQEAITKTNSVKSAFEQAEKGVISKEEALKTYNDTLGDSFGKATDLNQAEALYAAKTSAYIVAAGKRAQANALFAKAAEEQANALTAQFEDQTSFYDQQVAAVKRQYGFLNSANETLTASQKRGVVEAKKNSDAKSKIYTEEAQKLLEQAEVSENAAGIVSDNEKALNDELAKLAKDRADKAKAAADARLEAEKNALEKIRQLILGNAELSASQQEAEAEARADFRRTTATLEIKDAQELAARLLEIEQERIDSLTAIDEVEKAARIATLESNLKREISLVEGSAEQRLTQEKLLREKADIELTAMDVEFDQREVDRLNSVNEAKKAVADEAIKSESQRQSDRLAVMEANLKHEETLLQEAGKTDEQIAKATAGKRIEIARFQNAIIQENQASTDAERITAAADLEAQLFAIKKQGLDADVEATKEAEREKAQLRDLALDAANTLTNTFSQIARDNLTGQINDLASAANAEQQILADKLDANVISQEKYTAEIKKIELKQAAETAKLKKAQFEKQKRADIISAGISISKAVISGYSTQPFLPVGLAAGALASVLGLAQLAQIAGAETPAFATGGAVLSGQRITGNDGTSIRRSNGDNLLATVKAGEVILNETQQQRAGGAGFFASIGVPGFALGGSTGQNITTSIDSRVNAEGFVLDAIARMPAPVVGVRDIVDGIDRKTSVEQSANLF
jgi:hypothetical protein